MITEVEKATPRSYVVSLENRKRRGAGCERPAEILKAARELFLENGVEGVTTRQIAARVGISQTALYVYFCTKEQMLDSLAKEAWRGLGEALDAAAKAAAEQTEPADRLRQILGVFMRYWLGHPDDFRIVYMRRALRPCQSADDGAPGLCRNLLGQLAEWAEKALNAGQLRFPCSTETMALSMWAMVSGPVALRLAYPELRWPPEDKHVETTLDMIFHGCDRRPVSSVGKAATERVLATSA
jgi:AcrR family transcriptional regulator